MAIFFGIVDECPFECLDIFSILRSGLESFKEVCLLIVTIMVVCHRTLAFFMMKQVDMLVELLGKALLIILQSVLLYFGQEVRWNQCISRNRAIENYPRAHSRRL